MKDSLIQNNECLIIAKIISGNPAILEKDDFDPRGHVKVELAVSPDSKAAKKLQDAHDFAMTHGFKFVFKTPCIVEPKTPIYDGNSELLRKPLAENMLVVKTKSSSLPLLIGTDNAEDIDPLHWQPGTKVKVLVAFYPYRVDNYFGVSAQIKFMAIVEETKALSLHDIASQLLQNSDDLE